ncbi:hypothetical protein ALCH109712_07045 [Alkalicoccus chagannorensis]
MREGSNAVHPFAVGRKNWLFANASRGAEVSALLYFLVHTAQANRLNIDAYLHDRLEPLPNRPSLKVDVLKEILKEILKENQVDRRTEVLRLLRTTAVSVRHAGAGNHPGKAFP